jgi:probable HAF family extracellular repeat protein
VTGASGISNNDYHAFLWQNGQIIDLMPDASNSSSQSAGDAINNLGQVVGAKGDPEHGFIYSSHSIPPSLQDIEPKSQNSSISQSHANGINDSGVLVGIAGFKYGSDPSITHAFTQQPGQPLSDNIGALGGKISNAYGINSKGQVVGTADTTNNAVKHAFIWQNGTMVDIGALAGTNSSIAYAINSQGQVVGTASLGDATHAFIWQNGQITPLVAPGSSNALAINNTGIVVGDANGHASLWWNGALFDLNSQLHASSQGWVLTFANGINSGGDITGQGTTPSGQTHGFLATVSGLNWSSNASGSWDNSANWELGLLPTADMNATIAPSSDNLTVTAGSVGDNPAPSRTVNGLTIGGGAGNATLNLSAGSMTINHQLSVLSTGVLNFSATNLTAQSFSNKGTVNIIGTGSHTIAQTIAGDITNENVFKTTNTSVTYSGTFTNNGNYTSDPSINVFNNLSVGATGYLVGGAGDQFIVTGNFTNASIQNTSWNTSQSSLEFAAGQSNQHVMQLAGVDNGATASGFLNNFSWGSIKLDSGQSLTLDHNNAPGYALYTRSVILPGGIAQLSNISSNYNVYFDPALTDNQSLLIPGGLRFGSGSGQLLPWSFMPFSTNIIYDGSLTPNQQDFAKALNEACGSPSGNLAGRCIQLQVLSPTQKNPLLLH